MAGRIVLFGATGYTGRLTAEALVDAGARPLLTARSPERLAALSAELGGGLETASADVSRPDTVRALIEAGDVLVTTVGPFVRWGGAAVEAAADAGAWYLDSTGEPAFIRDVFERHGPAAERGGAGLVTAFGYDWVPGNLAGALALERAGAAASRVDLGYFTSGGSIAGAASGGTLASLGGAMLAPAFAYRGGALRTERGGARVRSFRVGERRIAGISVGSSEHFTLPRIHPTLREVGAYLGWFGPLSRVLQGFSAGTALATRVPGVRSGLEAATGKLLRGSTGGPDAEARAGSESIVVAEAFDAGGGSLARVELRGPNGYDLTARFLAWGAMAAARDGMGATGALGPVEAFGLEPLRAGCASAGLEEA